MSNTKTRVNKGRIGIDIRALMDRYYSGVPSYTHSLLNVLFEEDRTTEYVLFYNTARDLAARMPVFDYPNVRIVKTSYPNKVFNYIMQRGVGRPELDKLLGVGLFFMPHLNFASLSRSCRKVITVHDLSFLRFPRFFSLRKTMWHNALGAQKGLRNFNKVVAVSEHTRKDLLELVGLSPDRIKVIYSGLPNSQEFEVDKGFWELTRVSFGLPRKFFLYMGTLEPRKNVEGVIQAYETGRDRGWIGRECGLVLAGARGWKYKNIFRAWQNSPYRDSIHFTGYVDQRTKQALYQAAIALVYPSFYEGFGFPPLEAMRFGTPVVTSSVSSLPEVAGQAAILVNPYDIAEIATALGRIYIDPQLCHRMVEQGKKSAQKFSWQTAARQYLDLFQEILA